MMPRRGHCGEDRVQAAGVEAVGCGQVAGVEVGDREHQDREQRDRDLPPRRRAVGRRELLDAEEVDGGQDRHQDDRHDDAGRAEHRGLGVDPAFGEAVVAGVGQHRRDLDRCDRGGVEPGEPAERRARDAAEGVVREAGRAARDGVHAAELGVRQREDDDRDTTDHPGDDGGRAGLDQGLLGAEQPARADDRAHRGPHQADQADLALECRGAFLLRGSVCVVAIWEAFPRSVFSRFGVIRWRAKCARASAAS